SPPRSRWGMRWSSGCARRASGSRRERSEAATRRSALAVGPRRTSRERGALLDELASHRVVDTLLGKRPEALRSVGEGLEGDALAGRPHEVALHRRIRLGEVGAVVAAARLPSLQRA